MKNGEGLQFRNGSVGKEPNEEGKKKLPYMMEAVECSCPHRRNNNLVTQEWEMRLRKNRVTKCSSATVISVRT